MICDQQNQDICLIELNNMFQYFQNKLESKQMDKSRAVRSIEHMRYLFHNDVIKDGTFSKRHNDSFQAASKLIFCAGKKNIPSTIKKHYLQYCSNLDKFGLLENPSPSLLIGCGSLLALYFLILLLDDGWTIYVEQTAFTVNYIIPMVNTHQYTNLNVLKSGLHTSVDFLQNEKSKKSMLVTFLDRPFAPHEHVIEVSVLGEKFLFSSDDSLLMIHNWASICTFSKNGVSLLGNRPTISTNGITLDGRILCQNANIIAEHFGEFLSTHLAEYLCMAQLATRYHSYYKYLGKLPASWLTSLLRYSHMRNLSGVDIGAYDELINLLDLKK